MLKAVLDTNVVVSALLFRGSASRLVEDWQNKRFIMLLSGQMLEECARVMAYSKFGLTTVEITGLLERQLLPFAHAVIPKPIAPVIHKDPTDDMFLACAASGKADVIVSGDHHLLALGHYGKIPIVTVGSFFRRL